MKHLRRTLIGFLLLLAACGSDGRIDFPGVTTSDAGDCGALGLVCCANSACRSGLSCESNVCQQARVGDTGKPCARNGDCRSGICIPIGAGNVCTTTCPNGSGCTAGWLCAPLTGSSDDVCQCTPSQEVCDGIDNDCDGIVDNQPAVDALCVQQEGMGNKCVEGSCQLPGCTSNGDCLGAQICDPNTHRCVTPTVTDGGPSVTDGGLDGGRPDGGLDAGSPDGGVSDAGTPDAGVPDAGSSDGGSSCSSRYDCNFGQACVSGRCSAVSIGAGCGVDFQCGRGQICNAGQCAPGCVEARDCTGSRTCSPSRSCTSACDRDNPCPTGQYCSSSGGAPACVAANSCSSTSTCNSSAPGTVCSSGSCRNCASDNDCQVSPYGTGYTCTDAGFCSNTPMSCDIAVCSNNCYPQGFICDTNTCGCTGTTNCNNARCGGSACGAGTSCDPNSCTCTQNAACGSTNSCGSLAFLCTFGGGTCDGSCNCSTGGLLAGCITNADCGQRQVCEGNSCHDIAVDSQGVACNLARCRAVNHPCKNANTGAGCICSTPNSDGFSGSTSPVACD